jgi:hypothetical protein
VPISDNVIYAFIDRIRPGFAKSNGAALPVAIEKVRGMDNLPPALQVATRRQQLGLGKCAFFENVVYVVQQAHGTPEKLERRYSMNCTAMPPMPACLAAKLR